MKTTDIKRRLAAHGFWPKAWPVNNGMGPRTKAKIKKFQASQNLHADGIVGPLTISALNGPSVHSSKGERARAVKWATDRIGTVEHPAGSNSGPRISQWENLSGYPGEGAVPWCQCFVNASAYVGTGRNRKRFNPAMLGGYTVSVVDMADRGDHGLKRISLEEARPGDWVYFNWAGGDSVDHVGLFISRAGDSVSTIEGNTSSGDLGSQSNGGGVFRRVRDRSLIAAVVRPPFHS